MNSSFDSSYGSDFDNDNEALTELSQDLDDSILGG
jgi:hypothetical protein